MGNIKESLVIIGNGFDRFHDIKSSYWNFKEYLEESKEWGFKESLERYISSDELWSSFEYALGCLDYDAVRDNNSCYMLGYGDDNWRDSAHHDYQMMISEELVFANEISEYIKNWILSLDTKREQKLSCDIINQDNLYISFNYTDTLEKTYNISNERILYIHGKALRDNQLIVGHGDSTMTIDDVPPEFESEEEADAYLEYMSSTDVREMEADEIIKNYFKCTYKDVDEIIKRHREFLTDLNGIRNVFILGHSLADVDLQYFAVLNEILGQDVFWTVTYYTDDEREGFLFQLQKCGIGQDMIRMCKMEELICLQHKRECQYL